MVAIACEQTNPGNLVVSNNVAYWTNYASATSGGAIMSVSTSGGIPKVVEANQDYPWGIATDGTNLYWTNYDQAGANPGTGGPTGLTTATAGAVLQAPIAGGAPKTLASGLTTPFGIATDGTNVYFTAGLANGSGAGAVKKVAVGGTTVTTLDQSLNGPAYITVSGADVYWSNFGGATIRKIASNLTGPGTSVVLACNTAAVTIGPLGLVVNTGGTAVFYADWNNGNIFSVPTTPAGACGLGTKIASDSSLTPWGIATDGTNVYFANQEGSSLESVVVAGGTATKLTTSTIENPTGVAVDANGVYVTGQGTTPGSATGHIWMISPP